MNSTQSVFRFSSSPWKYDGPGGWIFISLPRALSDDIRKQFKSEEEGWGRLTVRAKIGQTEWKTAIWFDSKASVYSLPLKKEIRTKEHILIGKQMEVMVTI